MIGLAASSLSCTSRDWNPIAASSPESAVAAVLGGFVFSGIVVILSTRERRKFEAAQALKLLSVTFLGLVVTSYLLANDSGEQTCPRADSLVVIAGGPLGTFSILLLVAITWLTAAYRDELEDVLRLMRVLIYVGSAFVVLLLCVSAQSFVSSELGGGKSQFALSLLGDIFYGFGALAIGVGFAVLGLGRWRLAWWAGNRRRWVLCLPRASEWRHRPDGQLRRSVDICFYAATSYLALVGLGAGVVIGLPQNWYTPISLDLVYLIALSAFFAPVPVFVTAVRALAPVGAHAVDRRYWAKKGAPETVALADKLLVLVRHVNKDDQLALRLSKDSIGLTRDGRPLDCIIMFPQKHYLCVSFKVSVPGEIAVLLEGRGFDSPTRDPKSGSYWLFLTRKDFYQRSEILAELIRRVSAS